MTALRLAVVGAGAMARRRCDAFLATGRAEVVGVVARHADRARALGRTAGGAPGFDDLRRLPATRPDAVLVEVPNAAQDAVVRWALDLGLHVLIGGPLASSVRAGEAVLAAARARDLVVEAGYEARYKPAWETARRVVTTGGIGRVVAVQTVALWDCPPGSWYARQRDTAGMPMVHMTYAFINPIRWIFGDPTHVSAFANRVVRTGPAAVREETCVANLLLPGGVLCAMLAGFVNPVEDEAGSWAVRIVGGTGAVVVHPGELDGGRVTVLRDGRAERDDTAGDAFAAQAAAFLDTVGGRRRCRNRPEDTLGDLRTAEAVVRSARRRATVALSARP